MYMEMKEIEENYRERDWERILEERDEGKGVSVEGRRERRVEIGEV